MNNQNVDMLYRSNAQDQLTGLADRYAFSNEFQQRVKAYRGDSELAIVLIDIDYFHRLNDLFSYRFADHLLVAIANRLIHVCGDDYFIARLSADTFALCTECVGEKQRFYDQMRQLKHQLEAPYDIDRIAIDITLSMGIAFHPTDGKQIHHVFQHADRSLRRVKESGRNAIHHMTSSAMLIVGRELDIAQRLAVAVKEQQFSQVYQPIIDIKRGEIVGFEALIRWCHPQLGNIRPDEFIHIAEATGMISHIGHWVVDNALSFLADINQSTNSPLAIYINVSPFELLKSAFKPHLIERCEHYGVNPNLITIEITENAVLRLTDTVKKRIDDLIAYGFNLAIDDFGNGFFSFNYLRMLAIDIVKLDKNIVQSAAAVDALEQKVMLSLISIMNSMTMKILGEGVETKEQLDYLLDHDFDYGQGYYFARPMTQADALDYVLDWATIKDKLGLV